MAAATFSSLERKAVRTAVMYSTNIQHMSAMARVVTSAPIGMPDASPLAMVRRSGVTPKLCAANAAPVRPKPQITSSNTSRMPCASQISRRRFK